MNLFIIIIVFILIAIDQITKYIAVNNLKPLGSISIIDKILSFTFVENRGAAFGIFQGKTLLLSIITICILIAIIYLYSQLPKTKVYRCIRFCLVLIASGAVGNLIDRLLRGYVIDFFHATFINFPVFNVADIYVVVGAILMAIIVIFFIKEE